MKTSIQFHSVSVEEKTGYVCTVKAKEGGISYALDFKEDGMCRARKGTTPALVIDMPAGFYNAARARFNQYVIC